MRASALLFVVICVPVIFAASPSLPASYPATVRSAWQCYTNGDYTNSLAHYQAALQAAPASLEARLGGLLPLLALGRFAEAELLAGRVLRQYPANYYANLRLACALRRQGKLAPAEAVLSRLLPLHPTDVSLLLELALVKLARQQNTAAKGLFRDVLILAPDNAIARQHLAAPPLLDEPLPPPRTASVSLRPPEAARAFRAEAAAYYAYFDYHGTVAKDHAHAAGLYAALGGGLHHFLEAEADYLHKFYRGYPSLRQDDITLAYANFSLPHLKLRGGGHYVTSEDPATDQGWVAFGGAEYYVAARWAAGLDGYFTQYPNFPDRLDVVQLTPHLGVNLWRGANYTVYNDLRGYWIHLNRDMDGQRDFFSVENRLGFNWRRWTLSAMGWAGAQMFAVRNDGFALYNLSEKHVAGGGAEVRYAFSDHLALAWRVQREEFRDTALTPRAAADMYVALLSLKF